jgi:hypothetical protein
MNLIELRHATATFVVECYKGTEKDLRDQDGLK